MVRRSGRFKSVKGTQEVTSQTTNSSISLLVTSCSGPAPLRVYEWQAAVIRRLANSVAAAAEQGEADGQDTVTYATRVRPRTGEQDEEELQVQQQEDQYPHPSRKWWQVGVNALTPAGCGGEGRRAGHTSLHVLQTEPLSLKHIVHQQHAEQQVEKHTHPAHPLTEVHHPPYCRGNRSIINIYMHFTVVFIYITVDGERYLVSDSLVEFLP